MTGEPEGLGLYGIVTPFGGDSSMTTQICLTHSIIDCGVPATVMALSVELGNMSPATCTWAPADSLISLILQPPLPISEPHWLAGTTRRMVTGGLLVAVLFDIELLMSSSSFSMIIEKALKIEVVGPASVMILSGQFPSEILMRAPLSSLIFFTDSPFLPMMLPTSLPCMRSLMVKVTFSPPSTRLESIIMTGSWHLTGQKQFFGHWLKIRCVPWRASRGWVGCWGRRGEVREGV